jgi:hypothetical protein
MISILRGNGVRCGPVMPTGADPRNEGVASDAGFKRNVPTRRPAHTGSKPTACLKRRVERTANSFPVAACLHSL